MKKSYLIITLLGAILLIGQAALSAQTKTKKRRGLDTSTVQNVDLDRYTGRWYEIARLPHSFERGMTHTTANYTKQPDGTIKVVNAGRKEGGHYKESVGKARPTDVEGRLMVTFFLFPAQYNIMELDTVNYTYSMVGSSSPKYFWILSRSPQLPEATLEMLLTNAAARGYDLSELIMVEQ